ncbi:hypothetical protein DUNSADRAFT_8493 [Dunaliella salina]|uniref:Encoded protein n=1 Tax=Dunaliella salina TaxID=3046 RepID=A0ABQ7GJD2_DUNSA|nr:hypothetical protein DUNSADRAFT_8493 [Dunaliella salina]|eukprot:KAF5834723.1 hypothetical protein DUNSADRAFT_8493 [Dunaliella salina]
MILHSHDGLVLGLLHRTQVKVENAGDECGPPSPADPSSLRGGQAKKDACAPAPSVFLVARSEGPDRLTPLQQVKKAISNAFFVRIGNWGTEPCRRVQSDTPQPAKAPPEQDKASISNPLDSQIPSSPGTGSRTPIRQLKPGLSRSANARMPSTDSMERGVQHLPLKSCFSRSMDRTLVKHVSFSLDGAAEVLGEGPGEASSCARTSDCRPSSTFPSEDTPSCSSGPRSSNPPPASPDNSAKSGSTRSRSSADTFFFQGILGRSRRGSKSDESLPTLEHSEAGDGDAAQEEKPRVAGRKGSLEFYQFAKPFDLGLEGEDGLQLYACSPTGDEGDAAIVDHAGCVVRRVKAGRRKRRNGYMLEAELAVRCFAIDGMEGTESWPVQLANAIVAIPPPFHQRAKSAEDLCLLSHL